MTKKTNKKNCPARLSLQCLQLLAHKVKEGKLSRAASVFIYEATGEVAAKDALEVVLGHALEQSIQSNLLNKEIGERILEHTVAEGNVVPQISLLELLVEIGDGERELVREDGARLAGLLVFAPDGLKLESRIVLDGLLNRLDVLLVKLGDHTVANAHVLDKAFVVKGEGSEDLHGRAGDTTLVGAGVLEQNRTGLLETKLGVLGEEEIGTLDNVRDDGLAVLDEVVDIAKVNRLGATTARNQSVALDIGANVESVPEAHAVGDDVAVGKGDISILHKDAVTFRRKFAGVEMGDHDTLLGQAQELLLINALGIHKNTGSINCDMLDNQISTAEKEQLTNSNVLLIAEKNLVGTKITVRTTGLHLADGGGINVELAVNALNILSHTERGHTIGIVRNATEARALSSEEGLPPRCATNTSVLGGPVDKAGGVLVRTHEENLGLLVEIHNRVLDTRAGRREEKIKDGVNVLLEGNGGFVLMFGIEQNDTLAAALGNILILALLSVGEVVVLVKHGTSIDGVSLPVPALDDTDTTTCNVAEALKPMLVFRLHKKPEVAHTRWKPRNSDPTTMNIPYNG